MDSDVIVVGGGIGGLTTAVALARRGVAVDVLEARPTLGELGAGLTLWPNALAALARLGLDGAVREQGHELRTMSVHDRRGRALGEIEVARLAHRLGHPSVGITRPRLHGVLVDAARDAGIPVHVGARCVAVEPVAGGRRALLEDGRAMHADLVVGADGLNSAVRAQLHGDTPTYAGYLAWRAVSDVELPTWCADSMTWRGPDRLAGAVRQSRGSFWYVTRTRAEDDRGHDTDPARLPEELGDWHAPLVELIAGTPAEIVHVTGLYDRPPRWGRGPVTLLGDAAHPMRPSLGQGACQALEDALALADAVGDGGPHPLRRYEAARRRRVERIVRWSRWVAASEQVRSPVARRLGDLALAATPPRVATAVFERAADHRRRP